MQKLLDIFHKQSLLAKLSFAISLYMLYRCFNYIVADYEKQFYISLIWHCILFMFFLFIPTVIVYSFYLDYRKKNI